MAPHSSVLAWEIPWTEESDEIQSTDHKELDLTEWLNTYKNKAQFPAIFNI